MEGVMKTRLVLMAILVLGMLFLLTTVVSADREDTTSQGILLAGSLGGDISAVAVDGSLAYVGEGSGLAIVDISNLQNPARIARLELAGIVSDLFVSAGVAYIADGAGGLQVVDVHNPSQTYVLSSLATACPATSLFLSGSLVYLGEGDCGLQIIDVSDPGNPLLRGSYPGLVNDSWVAGSRAYLAGEDLEILNVSNPDAPVLLGTYPGEYGIGSVQVSGNHAFAANSYLLQIIDVSNPISPTLSGQFSTGFSIKDVSVDGAYAYLLSREDDILSSSTYCRMDVLDVSNLSQPELSGGTAHPAYGYDDCNGHLQVVGNTLFAADGSLEIIDSSNPQAPTLTGRFISDARPVDVQVQGGQIYLADKERGMTVMNANPTGVPVLVGSYPYTLPSRASELRVVEHRAYVAVSLPSHPHFPAGRLDILDVSDPVSPTLLGSYAVTGIQDMHLDGERAYLVDARAGFSPHLEIVDASNPAAPQMLGEYGTTSEAFSTVYASGDTAYVYAYGYAGGEAREFRVLDVSNPLTPMLVGALDSDYLYDIQGVGDLIYGLSNIGSLDIIDVSNPQIPVRETRFALDGAGYQLQVTNGLASIALQTGGVEIVDVHDPASPVKLASYDTPGSASAVQVVGDTLYVSDGAGGLQVLRYSTWTSALLEDGSGSLISPDDDVRYDFPPGTFSAPVTVTHVIRAGENAPSAGALFNIGQDFEVSAVYRDNGLPARPQLPFTVTVNYSDNSAFESSLGLYSWDGSQWVPAQGSHVILAQNQVVATPDHFSFWALLGETQRRYLPLVP
jgi:hypothetical protein